MFIIRPDEFTFEKKKDSNQSYLQMTKQMSASIDKRRSMNPSQKNNRTMDSSADVDELLAGNWKSSNTTGSTAPIRGNSLVRRMTMRPSKVSTLLEVQEISASYGSK